MLTSAMFSPPFACVLLARGCTSSSCSEFSPTRCNAPQATGDLWLIPPPRCTHEHLKSVSRAPFSICMHLLTCLRIGSMFKCFFQCQSMGSMYARRLGGENGYLSRSRPRLPHCWAPCRCQSLHPFALQGFLWALLASSWHLSRCPQNWPRMPRLLTAPACSDPWTPHRCRS